MTSQESIVEYLLDLTNLLHSCLFKTSVSNQIMLMKE